MLALFSITLPNKIQAQIIENKESRAFSEYEDQKAKIDEEIKQLKAQEWAGEYNMFDEFLTVAPKSGFAFFLRKGIGDYGYSTGDVQMSDGKLNLISKKPNKWEPLSIFSSEIIPVLWGERHYLIPSSEMMRFINTINEGYEPGSKLTFFGNRFFLRTGDEDKQVSRMPNIPEQWRDYLLKKPIRARILEIGESIESVDEYGEQQKVTTVILNVGSNSGVKEGMEFMTISPSGVHEDVIITKVEKVKSQGKVIKSGLYATSPDLNWKLSTSGRDIK
ncbi:MAG: hypothetical protein ABJA66_17955 [Actinomycetota bacterium]